MAHSGPRRASCCASTTRAATAYASAVAHAWASRRLQLRSSKRAPVQLPLGPGLDVSVAQLGAGRGREDELLGWRVAGGLVGGEFVVEPVAARRGGCRRRSLRSGC
jgi:hypothetical protein